MPRTGDEEQVRQVAEAIAGLLVEAVQATIDSRSPEPARECVAEFLDIDERAAPEDGGGPAQLMATLTLVRWASLIRSALAERPDRADEALGWIEEALGRRYRARARYLSGALRNEEEAGEIMIYTDALQQDFLPAFVWLVAGSVAVHGSGSPAWLRELETAPAQA